MADPTKPEAPVTSTRPQFVPNACAEHRRGIGLLDKGEMTP